MKDSDEFKYFDKGDKDGDETIISTFQTFNIPNCTEEEVLKYIEWMKNKVTELFFKQVDKEIIWGISPIQQSKELISKIIPVTSCICCKHWRINLDRTPLIGMCEKTYKDSSYDAICNKWEKIN